MIVQFTHAEMVSALVADPQKILDRLSPEALNLLHMAVGISGEAGEILDAVKKLAIYDKPLDVENVIEELGDLEFYMEGLRQAVGVTRQEVLNANMSKLGVRYPGFEFSTAAAIARADKE